MEFRYSMSPESDSAAGRSPSDPEPEPGEAVTEEWDEPIITSPTGGVIHSDDE